MAVEARLTKQMPFVTTPDQAAIIAAAASDRRISKAAVLREALDIVFGTRNAELVPGQTIADAVSVGQDSLDRR